MFGKLIFKEKSEKSFHFRSLYWKTTFGKRPYTMKKVSCALFSCQFFNHTMDLRGRPSSLERENPFSKRKTGGKGKLPNVPLSF